MKDTTLYYSVGALLYCPANHDSFVTSLTEERFGTKYSLALCLEDTICDNRVEEAEDKLIQSLHQLKVEADKLTFYIPKIFIRVREPKQISSLISRLDDAKNLITGFIIPKFTLNNADDYINEIVNTNTFYNKTFYIMPIFESPALLDLRNRYDLLYSLKEKLDAIEDIVLNIRVGGNDLSHVYGFRRHKDECIHEIKPIANLLSDIVTVYGADYVISGPVFEYYSGEGWDSGLRNELSKDRLNGFIGKTAIHPNQIALINEAYKVSKTDYLDAASILDWDDEKDSLVSGNASSERMNEYKTHFNWARTILNLAKVYGIIED